jgi:cytochrome c
MRVGHVTAKAQAAGPMAEAIDKSLRHLTEGDLRSIAVFLKGVPAVHEEADTRPRYAWGTATDDLPSIRGVALPTNLDQMTGPQLYDAECSTCHQAHGQGSFDGGLPPLFHNTALGRTNTNNLVMVMLAGIHRETEPPSLRRRSRPCALVALPRNWFCLHDWRSRSESLRSSPCWCFSLGAGDPVQMTRAYSERFR